MSIPSLSLECSAIAQQLRSELASVILTSDSSGFATVMGTGCKTAGIVTPSELSGLIKGDPGLIKAFESTALSATQKSDIAKAIRGLMDGYAAKVADATFAETFHELDTRMGGPNLQRASAGTKLLDCLDNKIFELKAAAARAQNSGSNVAASDLSATTYAESIKFVTEIATKMDCYDRNIANLTNEIDTIMFSSVSEPTVAVAEKQMIRKSMISERDFVQQRLLKYFDGNSRQQKDTKIHLKELKIPEQLEKDKGVELIMAMKAFMKNRATGLYAVMPDLIRIMAESKIGNYHKPTSKRDGYSGVPIEIRAAYTSQSQELYDELCLKVPAKVMNNIRVSFKYGKEDKQVQCEEGDGPMAVFCLLALYRPAGVAYRDSLRLTLEQASNKFKDGTNPLGKIKELRKTILEAQDLNVRILWRTTGKGIVTVMSERGNTFAQKLAKYNETGGVADPENCIVELNRLYTDIEETIVSLEEAGVDVKRVMQIRVMSAGSGAADKVLGNCWYGEGCTKEGCKFEHSKNSNKQEGKGKGKGQSKGKGKGKGQGKGQGKGGKGKGKGQSTTCKAKGCTGPSRGWPLCDDCRRVGLEKGEIQIKDGTMMPVKAVTKKHAYSTDSALMEQVAELKEMMEKHVNVALKIEELASNDGDDVPELFVGNGKPRCVQKAQGKKRAFMSMGIMDRLGKKPRTTDEELEAEFEDSE
jgi:hypothetical protein